MTFLYTYFGFEGWAGVLPNREVWIQLNLIGVTYIIALTLKYHSAPEKIKQIFALRTKMKGYMKSYDKNESTEDEHVRVMGFYRYNLKTSRNSILLLGLNFVLSTLGLSLAANVALLAVPFGVRFARFATWVVYLLLNLYVSSRLKQVYDGSPVAQEVGISYVKLFALSAIISTATILPSIIYIVRVL